MSCGMSCGCQLRWSSALVERTQDVVAGLALVLVFTSESTYLLCAVRGMLARAGVPDRAGQQREGVFTGGLHRPGVRAMAQNELT